MNIGVVGAGPFGLAAALEPRIRNHHVAVFERGGVRPERASFTDATKIIRRDGYGPNKTYHEILERS